MNRAGAPGSTTRASWPGTAMPGKAAPHPAPGCSTKSAFSKPGTISATGKRCRKSTPRRRPGCLIRHSPSSSAHPVLRPRRPVDRVRRTGLRAAGRPLRRTSRLAPIDPGRSTGASPDLPAIGGLGIDIGPSDEASGAPPKKREKNRARPNRARSTQTAAPCPMQDNIGARNDRRHPQPPF